MDGSQKEGVTFKFASERGGSQKRGGGVVVGGAPSENRGVQTWRKLWLQGMELQEKKHKKIKAYMKFA